MTGPLTVYRGTETLRRGWTTGSCAAAASQAAAILLLTGSAPAEIRLLTPGGVTFNLPVEQASLHDGEAVCAVRKDAGMTRTSQTACSFRRPSGARTAASSSTAAVASAV